MKRIHGVNISEEEKDKRISDIEKKWANKEPHFTAKPTKNVNLCQNTEK
jgi:hypothetical protein